MAAEYKNEPWVAGTTILHTGVSMGNCKLASHMRSNISYKLKPKSPGVLVLGFIIPSCIYTSIKAEAGEAK